jgi:hypothetical protein
MRLAGAPPLRAPLGTLVVDARGAETIEPP